VNDIKSNILLKEKEGKLESRYESVEITR